MTDELMSEIKAPRMNGSIITVVGVGGAGGNAVNHMWNLGIRGVTFMVCNTDQQALDKSPVELKIRLGAEGLGAGNDPENGRRAAVESLPEIRQTLEESGTKMISSRPVWAAEPVRAPRPSSPSWPARWDC